MGLGSTIAREGFRAVEHAARVAELKQQGAQRAEQMRAQVAVREPAASPALAAQRMNGEKELGYVSGFLRHHALWPSEATLNAATLAVAAYHAKDPKTGLPPWMYMFRFLLTAEEGGSGKSLIARLMGKLCPNPKMLIEFTKPALIDLIGQQATVIITEANIRLPANRKLIATCNAGYEPDHVAVKMDHGKRIEIPMMGPLILDGNKAPLTQSRDPDMRTLMTRCVVAEIVKGPAGFRAPRFDGRARAVAEQISQRMAAWMAQEVADGIADIVPELPGDLDPRRISLWEPMAACALRAGGPWPERMWEACISLENAVALPDAGEDQESELDALMAQWDEKED